MAKRYLVIWFRYLKTDWCTIRKPALKNKALVLSSPDHGRMVITGTNFLAEQQDIFPGMVLADAKAIFPSLQVLDDRPGLENKLLQKIAEWSIRYTPVVYVHLPDCIILDATGCAHLWKGEEKYLATIVNRFQELGYFVHAAIADTIGAAWAVAHYGKRYCIIEKGQQINFLRPLPPEALRIENDIVERLHKLGLKNLGSLIDMPHAVLNRRFGKEFMLRLHQAVGYVEEILVPVQLTVEYQERLNSLEPIATRTGIEMALEKLLNGLCSRLRREQKGLRVAIFRCYRIDNKIEKIEIATNHASHNSKHLFKLFEIKLDKIEPAWGIELFSLEALKVEDAIPLQECLWQRSIGLDNVNLAELLDRFHGKFGTGAVHRYLPDEHYWPERSVKQATSLTDIPVASWNVDRPRPLQLLPKPELIYVTAPIPDYPPMLFRYKGKLHKVINADGPERIEQEWWLQQGQHRDYYIIEDENGHRFWIFRAGHYTDNMYQWFLHGFFA
jgi:protein ImuB